MTQQFRNALVPWRKSDSSSLRLFQDDFFGTVDRMFEDLSRSIFGDFGDFNKMFYQIEDKIRKYSYPKTKMYFEKENDNDKEFKNIVIEASVSGMTKDDIEIKVEDESIILKSKESTKNISSDSIKVIYSEIPHTQWTKIIGKFDIEKDMLPAILKSKGKAYGYLTKDYIKDMGTPERLEKVRQDYFLGKIKKI